MKKQEKNKSYLIIGLIQLITIVTFTVAVYLMYTNERIILNPVPYTVVIGVVMIIIDFIIMSTIFKEYETQEINQSI